MDELAFVHFCEYLLALLLFRNGDILYLANAESTPPTPSTSRPTSAHTSSIGQGLSSTFQLTPRCNHGLAARCPHCMGAAVGEKVEGKCNHGPSATCIHCSKFVKEQTTDVASWLCAHAPTVFCPKCLPPEDPTASKQLACTCDKSKGQECVRCLIETPTIKVDKIPYQRYLADHTSLCKFKHPATTTCAFCTPAKIPSFKGKKDCNRGHAPWPKSVCLNCAPPNAIIREQSFRHCDSLSVEPKIIQGFYQGWVRKGIENARAAILFGKVSWSRSMGCEEWMCFLLISFS